MTRQPVGPPVVCIILCTDAPRYHEETVSGGYSLIERERDFHLFTQIKRATYRATCFPTSSIPYYLPPIIVYNYNRLSGRLCVNALSSPMFYPTLYQTPGEELDSFRIPMPRENKNKN